VRWTVPVTAPVFLKLGGALLTEKGRRETSRPAVIDRLVREVAAWAATSGEPLVLGHGSGSFAHFAVRTTGFLDRPHPLATARIAAAARRLDAQVIDALIGVALPAVPVPAAALAVCVDGAVVDVRAELVAVLLAAGLLPVIYGDAAPDTVRGGAIASTEPILVALARHLAPSRIILATDVDGVYPVDPHHDPTVRALPVLTPATADALGVIAGARPGATDVTGGMGSKVQLMLGLVTTHPALEVRIVSGLRPGAVEAALGGAPQAGGTVIRAR
jgi:isopentenyl phosphate kinase